MWKIKVFLRAKFKQPLKKIYQKVKKMSKKKLLLAGAALAAVLFAVVLSVVLLICAGWIPMLITDAVLVGLVVLAGLAALLMEKLSKRWYRLEKPTSYFTDLRWRDTPALVVGSTKAWKYVHFERFHSKVYNCVTYKRSTDMDFAMLKTYHSHVKKNGTVFLVYDYSEARKLGNRITPRDFSYVHPHIFLALHKKENKKKSAHPMLSMPLSTVGHVWNTLLKKMGAFRNSTWKVADGKNVKINTDIVCKEAAKLDRMIKFCFDRNLVPQLLLLNGNENDNQANEIIRAYLAPRYYFFDAKIINNAEELNQLIASTVAE